MENSKLYAKIPKCAMMDDMLSCDAKAFYALLCTYNGYGNITAGTDTLAKNLGVDRKKLGQLAFELAAQGYIQVLKVKITGNFPSNRYKIVKCPDKYQHVDIFKERGISSYAYGLIEQRVLVDRNLDIKAKAIYAYFCALSGNTGSAYPSVEKILRDLNICESTYRRYIKQLVNQNYVQVVEHKSEEGRFCPNEYKLTGHPNSHKPSNYPAGEACSEKQCPAKPCKSKPTELKSKPAEPAPEKTPVSKPSVKTDALNKNTIKINNINKNNNKNNNQGAREFLKESKPLDVINQSEQLEKEKQEETDSTDKSELNNIIKILSDKPENSKLRRIILRCLADMLCGSSGSNRKYSPEKVAAYLSAHASPGALAVLLAQFEKSFMQSAGKPEIGGEIKNIYAYIKASLWRFLETYELMRFDFKTAEPKQNPVNFDHFRDKIARNTNKLSE